jgi:hypothetical protein
MTTQAEPIARTLPTTAQQASAMIAEGGPVSDLTPYLGVPRLRPSVRDGDTNSMVGWAALVAVAVGGVTLLVLDAESRIGMASGVGLLVMVAVLLGRLAFRKRGKEFGQRARRP